MVFTVHTIILTQSHILRLQMGSTTIKLELNLKFTDDFQVFGLRPRLSEIGSENISNITLLTRQLNQTHSSKGHMMISSVE